MTEQTVRTGERLAVSYDITNRGQSDGEQTVELRVDGEVVDSDALVLDTGEMGRMSLVTDAFTDEDVDQLYEVEIVTDDRVAQVMTVEVTDILDASVARPDDDSSFDDDRQFGHKFESTQEWSADTMEFRLSANISGATTAYIYDNDDNLLASDDISNLSAGDLFTIDQKIEPDTTYQIAADAGGDSYQVGNLEDPDYPYESEETDDNDDPIITITDGAQIGGTGNQAYNIAEIGNLS